MSPANDDRPLDAAEQAVAQLSEKLDDHVAEIIDRAAQMMHDISLPLRPDLLHRLDNGAIGINAANLLHPKGLTTLGAAFDGQTNGTTMRYRSVPLWFESQHFAATELAADDTIGQYSRPQSRQEQLYLGLALGLLEVLRLEQAQGDQS